VAGISRGGLNTLMAPGSFRQALWPSLTGETFQASGRSDNRALQEVERVSELLIVISTAKVVFDAFNIIFTEVRSGLNFNENHIASTNIVNSMKNADSEINSIASPDSTNLTINSDIRFSSDDKPVFRALLVALVRKAFSGIYPDAFHFVGGRFLD